MQELIFIIGSETVWAIEVVPYADQFAAAGLLLNEDQDWDDFMDSTANTDDMAKEEQMVRMLGTMLKGSGFSDHQITLRKRKDVFDVFIEKNGAGAALVMVCEYDGFINSEIFRPSLFMHHVEEYDVWQFPINATDDDIYQTIYPAMKSPGPRRP